MTQNTKQSFPIGAIRLLGGNFRNLGAKVGGQWMYTIYSWVADEEQKKRF